MEAESDAYAQCKPCAEAVEVGMQSGVGIFVVALGVLVLLGGAFGLFYRGERLACVWRLKSIVVE